MLDDLVEKALNGGYGELISGVILVLLSALGYYVHRQIKRYDKAYNAIFDEEGIHSSVKVIDQKLDSHDKRIEQVTDKVETLVNNISIIKGDTDFIRGWIEGGEADKKKAKDKEEGD